ncbi:ferredoxin [Halobacterium jilantaiense]|uniref:4Fe-4S single cluster domain-containing protein n=1 Tax=Halobacterium jilantaiense TaxID=355548 RepID=A0A1I0QNA2_9EURY|nr:ferredoxin [Halobacterium jilantaiense]SEW28601.1 4Fe-4S single cluster domain-containing protein [Halobacterium jilantaiense]
MYRVTIDRDACDGVFACLTRDSRFVEDDDGLATFDTDEGSVEQTDETVVGTFDDERVADAEDAAAACPLDAITVEAVEGKR